GQLNTEINQSEQHYAQLKGAEEMFAESYGYEGHGCRRHNIAIDRPLGELRLQNDKQIQQQSQNQCRDQQPCVRFQIAEQSPGYLPIVGLTDGLFFVKLFDCGRHAFESQSSDLKFEMVPHVAASSSSSNCRS